MSTGIESYTDMTQVGAFFPGANSAEWIMALVIFIWFVWWMAWQFWFEDKELKEAVRLYREVGMERAMAHGGAKILSDEEMKAREVQAAMGGRSSH